MDKQQAQRIIQETFENPFDEVKFVYFVKNLLNSIEEKPFIYRGNFIPDAYEQYISTLERIGKYSDGENEIDILIVKLKKESSIERARTMQRNFISWYLNGSRGDKLKDAALVAFVSPNEDDWRFSLVKMDYRFEEGKNGRIKVKEEFTPARRWSFLVGKNEKSHTAQSRFVPILIDDSNNPTLAQLEDAFNIEKVTKEFFEKYRGLFLWAKEELDKIVSENQKMKDDFESNCINTVDFAKKLLGQIIFLYFLQKKGWFGVKRDADWGTGPKNFLRELFEGKHGNYDNFFNDILEPLFYEALRNDRSYDDHYFSMFKCKIPFLNGGLFDPMNNYDWKVTDILLPNELFSNSNKTKEGDIGNGVVDIFDRYNFTVKEDEPLEKEVAIDPEMLGKVYEKFNAIRPDNYEEYKMALKNGQKGAESKFNKQYGVYYTPREIVHYMCQQSLINYLATELENKVSKEVLEFLILRGEEYIEYLKTAKERKEEGKSSDRYEEHEYFIELKKYAQDIDEYLSNIKVCDPAIGSGAFPVGMMTEIIKARLFFLETRCLGDFYRNKQGDEVKRNTYNYKRDCIQNSLYGVDIDSGAVEIAKLRLWLSLIVDEEDIKNIKPLPNLDYKIVRGNSLLGIEKNLLNEKLFSELERLKLLYFNETNPSKKQEYKNQISNIIDLITNWHKEFDFKVYFSEVFHEKKGFDVVIANPPYLGEKGHKEMFREIKQGNLGKFYHGKMDLFYFFFHLALNIGKQNSNVAFITTDYYPTATGAKKLRQDFKERAIVKNLINFNELKIFESALGQHNMITILQKGQEENAVAHTCITKKKGFADNKILYQILSFKDPETQYYEIAQDDLYDGDEFYIRMTRNSGASGDTLQMILDKVKKQGMLLGSICNVNQGIVTSADSLTKKHKENYSVSGDIGDGIFVLSSAEVSKLNKLNSFEKNIIKPFFKNSDIYRYYVKPNPDTYYIRLVCPGDKSIPTVKFPNIYHHLFKYKRILESRKLNCNGLDKVIAQGIWWLIAQGRRLDFSRPKIVSPQRSYTNIFAYNETDWCASADVYFITEKDKSVSLKYVLALLNSKLYYVWLYNRGKRKGEMLELYQAPLSEIPIKKIPESDQQPFILLVDQIFSLTQSEDYLENQEKRAQVKALEGHIDQLVYKLYELTEEEIKIVEGVCKV